MRHFSFLLLLLLQVTLGAEERLFVLIIGDLSDPVIGLSCSRDFLRWQELMEEVARECEMETRYFLFQGENFVADSVVDVLVDLEEEITKEDTVVFYFTGHGHTLPSLPSVWPVLQIPCEPRSYLTRFGGLPTEAVAHIAKELSPRLALIVLDCCNRHIGGSTSQLCLLSARGPLPSLLPPKPGYRTLFREAEGVVLVASSSSGEAAWSSDTLGGVFSYYLVDELRQRVHSTEVTWEGILQGVTKRLETRQTPQYQINPPW